MVLVFLLALNRGESELDAKISSSEKGTEWGDPDLSLPESCQPAPTCQKCILSHPSCAWCKQLVKMGLWPLSPVYVYVQNGNVCDCVVFWVHAAVPCVTDFVHVGLPHVIVCVCMRAYTSMQVSCVCMFMYLCIRVYTDKTCNHKFGGSVSLLVYREGDLWYVYTCEEVCVSAWAPITKLGGLSIRNLFLIVLEAGSPRPTCQPIWFLVRTLFLARRQAVDKLSGAS